MRIASIPAGHPYVQHSLGGVEVLPDPVPLHGRPGQWWPPVMWDAEWIADNALSFDVMHVHFGMESFSDAHMRQAIASLGGARRPLVVTVHDLENPQLSEQDRHLRQLSVLIDAADALITLTPGAAHEIQTRFGRTAAVIRHPRILRNVLPFADRPLEGPPRIGIHLKDLRPNVDGPGAVSTAIAALRELERDDVVLEVHLHELVRDEAAAQEVRALAEAASEVELRVHGRLDDEALAAALSRLSAAILPYRHGTHSGWLELCWDLGVPVLAPDVGYLWEQHQDGVVGFAAGSAQSLAEGIARILGSDQERRQDVRERAELRDVTESESAAAHLAIYQSVLSGSAESATADGPALRQELQL